MSRTASRFCSCSRAGSCSHSTRELLGFGASLVSEPSASTRLVAPDYLVPRIDRYYLKVCIMAERLFEGRSYFGV